MAPPLGVLSPQVTGGESLPYIHNLPCVCTRAVAARHTLLVIFAVGAVNAAVYMNGKGAGLYDMKELID